MPTLDLSKAKRPAAVDDPNLVRFASVDGTPTSTAWSYLTTAGHKVLVKGVNMRWKHVRRSQQNPQGGRLHKEFPIHVSNVMLFSEQSGKGVRVRNQIVDGKKARVGIDGTNFG